MNNTITTTTGRFILIFIFSLFVGRLSAYSPSDLWHLSSPAAGATIRSGELLVTVEYNEKLHLKQGSVQIFIDERIISNNVKFFSNKITLLYLTPLKAGEHDIEIRSNSDIGWLPAIKSTFKVGQRILPSGPDSGYQSKQPGHDNITANITAEYRATDVSGAGKDLRQSVPVTRILNVDAVATVGKFKFPFRFFNTSDEQYNRTGTQSRNYMQAGIVHKNFDLYYGDQNPAFDYLVLAGMRIFGAKAGFYTRRFGMQAVYGYLNRAVEGTQLHYSGNGPVPQNLRGDSTYYIPGTMKRYVEAVRFSFGRLDEGSLTSLSLMRSTDDGNSIKYGNAPRQNIAAGLDQIFVTNGSKWRVMGGLAFSLMTNNTSLGTYTEDQAAKANVPVDPAAYKNVFIINQSTIFPSKQSIAGYVNSLYRTKHQNITFEYRWIGAGYQSFGNPYLHNDQRSILGMDQFNFWKRKINLTIRYNFQHNNLLDNQISTVFTHIGGASLLFMPGPKWPQFGIMYSMQMRSNADTLPAVMRINDLVISKGAYINYLHPGKKLTHGLLLNFIQNDRTDAVRAFNDISNYSGMAGLTEQINDYHISFGANANYLYAKGIDGLVRPMYRLYTGNLRYKFEKFKTSVGTNVYFNNLSTGLGWTQRSSQTLVLSNESVKGFRIDLELGRSPYRDAYHTSGSLDYNETFVYVRMNYQINQKI